MPGLTSHKLHVKMANHLKLVYKGRKETTCDAWKAQNCCCCVCSWCPLLALTCPTGGTANLPERRGAGATVTPTAPLQVGKPTRGIETTQVLQCNYSVQLLPDLQPRLESPTCCFALFSHLYRQPLQEIYPCKLEALLEHYFNLDQLNIWMFHCLTRAQRLEKKLI